MEYVIASLIGGMILIGGICYACCVVSGNSHRSSEEEFRLYLEEKERVKNE